MKYFARLSTFVISFIIALAITKIGTFYHSKIETLNIPMDKNLESRVGKQYESSEECQTSHFKINIVDVYESPLNEFALRVRLILSPDKQCKTLKDDKSRIIKEVENALIKFSNNDLYLIFSEVEDIDTGQIIIKASFGSNKYRHDAFAITGYVDSLGSKATQAKLNEFIAP